MELIHRDGQYVLRAFCLCNHRWTFAVMVAMRRIQLTGLMVFTAITVSAQGTRVLFIGNSYTSVNNLPEMTRQLALSLGDTLVVASNSPGGYTFQQQVGNATTEGLISQGNWDFVVLQEQSQLPSFPPSQVATQCLPYAAQLVDSVRASSPCAAPVFYMTWGRQDGDAQNCASWPPVCTYDGMQQQLRQSYLLMAQNNNTACAPAGMAWKRVREEYPSINLYAGDGSHPSVAGTYLVACTMYSTFFRTSTVGATWHSTLDAATAATLQQVASSVVLDSLSTWNIGVNDPVAAAHFNDLGAGAVSFSQTSLHATHHFWSLGDGSTSTEGSFTHTYSTNGNYTVTYIASDDCGHADTAVFDVVITTLGMHEASNNGFKLTRDHGKATVHNPGAAGTLDLFDVQGRLLLSMSVMPNSDAQVAWPWEGLVVWRFTGREVRTGKLR